MTDFEKLLNLCQIEAINHTLNPNEAYIWRKICRAFSEKFNVSLLEAEEMSPEYVLTHIMESRLESMDFEENIESIIEMIRKIEDPNYQDTEDASLDDFIKQAEAEEKDRLKKGEAIFGTDKARPKNSLLESELPEAKVEPTRGSINLEYLEKLDREDEEN
jgi:hypothetical protein